ncbi:uncharacterized protein LOC125237223 [Leguminivora glycinivorella]|uniref:uncharacterized protein LOC125237223 n=1 Tax=Leguminivora glycinivorella TaxID=1035111 RepID=UPI00200DB198|nr:uncharacterized protein LOC125237223 [Leguminivora glycinivorella]
MEFPVKFLSLQKPELEYEVSIRGETPGSTVQDLRKQIAKLGPLFPSEDILESNFTVAADLRGVSDALAKVQSNLDSRPDRNVLLRTQNLLHHLHHRLNRIVCDESTQPMFDVCDQEFRTLTARFNSMKDTASATVLPAPSAEHVVSTAPINVNVTCDRGSHNELCKIKFDGKSCVRAFVERITEFCEARSISDSKLLSYATEIFTGDALHWYRNIKGQVSTWVELSTLLKQDFGQKDYDYRLGNEIRSRTQGESENITVYLSIMAGLFSRLSKPLPEDEKLEILLHNIRPCYASTLASASAITDINTLRNHCRNYESIQARLADFREPPRRTADTLAPEFAYSGTNKNNSFNNNKNFTYRNNNNKQYNNNANANTNNNNRSYTNNFNKYNNNNNGNEKQVHALTSTPSAKPLFCPRCRNNSHNLRQCPANKDDIYCFKCGHKGVKSPDCPTCKKAKPSSSKN